MTHTVDADFVRRMMDIRSDELDDVELEEYVDDAQELVLDDIAVWAIHEVMQDEDGNLPDIDGSNKLFYTKEKNIADINFNSLVDATDVVVYTWEDSDDETTATVAAVSSVNADTGFIQLTTAPGTTIDKLTCTYRYYLSKPNFTIIKIAVALMAGLLWIRKDKLLYPDQVQIGAFKWRFTEPVYQRLMQEYIKTVQLFKTGISQELPVQLPWRDPKIIASWYAEVGGID